MCRVYIYGIYEPYNIFCTLELITWGNKYDVIKAVIESALYIRAGLRYMILSFFCPPQNNFVGIKYDVIKAVVSRCVICVWCVYACNVIYIYVGFHTAH